MKMIMILFMCLIMCLSCKNTNDLSSHKDLADKAALIKDDDTNETETSAGTIVTVILPLPQKSGAEGK